MNSLRYKNGKTFYGDSIEIIKIDKKSYENACKTSRLLGLKYLSDTELKQERKKINE